MRYVNLGLAGLKVSQVCLGCLTFGFEADEATSRRIVDTALDAGITFFDTANAYNRGASEEILGRALKGRRHQVVVATKVFSAVGPGPNDGGLSRTHILRAVEDSLRRLDTDYIDLYQAHRWDPDAPLDETLRAFDDLVRQGKVRYLGCSNFAAWQLAKALWTSDKRNLTAFVSVQPLYNLLARQIERELLPLSRAEGVAVLAYNVLAGGLLTGKYRPDAEPPPGTRFADRPFYRNRYAHPAYFAALERYLGICREAGRDPAGTSVAWVLSRPGVTSAILGARRPEQLTETLAGFEQSLPADLAARIDGLWSDFPALHEQTPAEVRR